MIKRETLLRSGKFFLLPHLYAMAGFRNAKTKLFAILTLLFLTILNVSVPAVPNISDGNRSINPNLLCQDVSVATGMTTLRNTILTVPVNVDDTTGQDVISFDYTLTYNPAVLVALSPDQAGTLSSGMVITVNDTTPGVLVVSGFGANPLSGAGTLLNLKFFANGPIGSTTNLSFTGFKFNEGTPCAGTSNGNVTIVSGTITGAVTYANSFVTKPVPNTTLSAAGSPLLSTNSVYFSGSYSLSGMGSGPYTVTPSKTSEDTAISGFDAALIAQHVVGLITLTSAQAAAADVSEAAGITSFDAALIARFVVALPDSGSTGTWKFNPTSRSYPNVEANQSNQDYNAILMGEVSGDWNPPASFAFLDKQNIFLAERKEQPEAVVNVGAPFQNVAIGTNFTVPISVSDTTGQGMISYQFDLLYNSSVIQPQANPVDTAGTVSDGMFVTTNSPSPGLLKVVAFTSTPRTGGGILLNFKFTAAGGPPGSTSPLTWQNFMFNEGTPGDATTNGQITILGPTAASVAVSGRILTATGQPVSKAEVYLTGNNGLEYMTRSGPLGYYVFEEVQVGESYVLTVKAKQHTFNALLVSVMDSMTDLNLFANE